MEFVAFGVSGGSATVALGGGDLVEVRLQENPTTGYRWEPVLPGSAAVSSDGFTAGAEGIGAAGERVFVIRAGPGTRALRFVLRRAWEQTEPRAEAVVHILP